MNACNCLSIFGLAGERNGSIFLAHGLFRSGVRPLGFERIDGKSIDFQTSADFRDLSKIVFPMHIGDSKVIKEDFNIVWPHVMKYYNNGGLGHVNIC